jgi:hypothetical protein
MAVGKIAQANAVATDAEPVDQLSMSQLEPGSPIWRCGADGHPSRYFC